MNAFSHSELSALTRNNAVSPEALLPSEILDVVIAQRFGVEYQPIVSVQAEEVVGYQASARFWTREQQALDTGKMFAHLHQNPLLLFHTELEMKKLQIAQFPFNRHGASWLMLDLDIDSFMEGGQTLSNPFLALFKSHAWSERELVINLVENHHTADAHRSQRVIELLQQSGTAVALEDLGVRWGMFSLSAFLDASIIKFNGMVLKTLNESAAQATVDWLVSAARRIGVQTIMSGVGDCEQFEWARRLGVDCVQGNLFARQTIEMR
ncbi:putative cyclic di-GMP phosphodiesterase PdeC [Methylophilaceae bacterium]|nr:putative cyclic di-GMP phosphodiesterase PdeC [Methylophilaceae bacterium]